MTEPVPALSEAQIREELERFKIEKNYVRPERSTIDATRLWRNGVPNYDKADLEFFRGRTAFHAAGSLEAIVENAVKRWEMEATHLNFSDWESVDHSSYSVSANGGPTLRGEDAASVGNYNWLMANTDKSQYDAESHSFESSHELFHAAFPEGFPWEVLAVFSGPPRVAFSWRHWAKFSGEYEGRKGDNKTYELFGFAVVDLNDELKIKQIQIFYKPEDFLKALKGEIAPESLHKGASLIGSVCPFAHSDNSDAANGSSNN